MIVLDTSLLSLAFRRRRTPTPEPAVVSELRHLIRVDANVVVPGLALQELLSGVRSPEQFQRLDSALSGFPLLLAERSTHLKAAEVANACRAAGVATSTGDCLIAAHALEHDAALFTVDQDFTRMAPVCELRLYRERSSR